MKDKRIIFLGGYFNGNNEEEIATNSLGPIDYAANKFQNHIIKGIIEQDDVKLESLSVPFIGSFPKKYKKFYFKSMESDSVSFINAFGVRNLSRYKRLKKKAKNLSNIDDSVILVYSAHTPLLMTATYMKKRYKNITICVIVPDLPQYMNNSNKVSNIYKALKKLDMKLFDYYSQYIDSFVLLTEQMNEKINSKQLPYTIIEGISSVNDSSHELGIDNYILYSGTLNEKYGIKKLVESFENIKDKDVKLVIIGSGDYEYELQEKSYLNSRIEYLGQLPNNQVLMLQKKALLLVNPRTNEEEFTKYSFPSKNIEYLTSGRPVICYKLDGIPDDYNNIFNYIIEDSDSLFTTCLDYFIGMDEKELNSIGVKGKNFVLEHKNYLSQTNKILDLVFNKRSST